jgi:hypothetical protein
MKMKKIKSLLGIIAMSSSVATQAQNVSILPADTNRWIGVSWDRSPSPEVSNYKIHYGPYSRNYTNFVNAGNNTTALITNLVDNANYYISATGQTGYGAESGFSNEILAFTGPRSTASSTNISGNWFYIIKQTRFTNDNIFRYLQSTNGTSGWTKPIGVTKIAETSLTNAYSTTWKVPAPVPLPAKMFFEMDWVLDYLNPSLKPKSTVLKMELK